MPDEYVKLSVAVDADGSVLEATYADDQVADIKVQPFGSGAYDVAFLIGVEASETRSVTAVSSPEGDAAVTGFYCNFHTNFERRKYTHRVTVRVQTSRNRGFRLDLQLA